MAKTDKSSKKIASKKVDPIKKKPAVPASTKDILAKAKAIASSKKNTADSSDSSSDSESPVQKKAAVNSSSDSSSESEESSSEDSDNDVKKRVTVPAKASPPKKTLKSKDESTAKKVADDSNDSSDASTSEDSSSDDSDADDKKKPSTPAKAPANKVKGTSDSEDDSSDASDSGESSSEEGNEETSTTAQSIIPEAKNKRKADAEAAAPPKKLKLENGHAEPATSSEEEIKSVFVGRLSWNVDNDWLAQEFAECGEVESAHVQMDRDSGRSRGFGYVHFKTADAVEKALALSGKEIDGRPINVDKSNPPNKKASAEKRAQNFGDTTSPPSAVLFVGNLSFGVDEDMLWESFSEHGDIKSVRIPTDRESGRPKGFAYVEFSDVAVAKKAHGALQGLELDGRSIRLDFSQPRDNSAPRGGGQGGRGGRGRGGFGGGDRGRGFSRGGRGGDRGGRGGDRGGRGRGGRGRGGFASFEGQKITF